MRCRFRAGLGRRKQRTTTNNTHALLRVSPALTASASALRRFGGAGQTVRALWPTDDCTRAPSPLLARPQLLNPLEVCRLLGVAEDSVRRWPPRSCWPAWQPRSALSRAASWRASAPVSCWTAPSSTSSAQTSACARWRARVQRDCVAPLARGLRNGCAQAARRRISLAVAPFAGANWRAALAGRSRGCLSAAFSLMGCRQRLRGRTRQQMTAE